MNRFRRVFVALTGVAAAVAAGLTGGGAATLAGAAPAAQAAGPRPLFQLPFPCGEQWVLATYPGHDDYDIDMTPVSGAASGRPILAAYGGTVAAAGWSEGGGYRVRIDHGSGWQTLYLHMIENPPVSAGQRVVQGQQIGRVGSTGDSSGPHLHYEQLRDGAKSEAYFNGVASGITDDGTSPARRVTSANCGGSGGSTEDVVQFGDLNGDGLDDLVERRSDKRVVVYWNRNANPNYAYSYNHAALTAISNPIRVGDFNGDNRDDILELRPNNNAVIFWNNGSGTFSWSNNHLALTAVPANEIKVGDLNADGLDDIVQVRDNGDTVVFWNAGNGGFSWSNNRLVLTAMEAARVQVGDVTGDGLDDIVQTRSNGNVVVFVNTNANPNFNWSTNAVVLTGQGNPGEVRMADLDADGRDDLMQIRSNGDVVVFWNSGGNPRYSWSENRLVLTSIPN
ncbi:VCBS repeat domain-containing M23 family metallopeptidase [Plantactinospora endophytica]|uniref:M23ase beta-sheet core domain-containing protein n=1 Tax=Plantactinospora endophytica TaxID=673535 RepID=A0ABQ4E134_9ACTN|nr:hypothetical protein Pen02_33700 [Plantactinospora endophytica]